MWSDNETADDLLGFQVHADLIRSVVTDAKMLPVTIGIFGDWGGGKTSIMKMLERDLEPENWPQESVERQNYEKAAVIYFNGWQFEGYDDAKAAILSSVLLSLGDHKRFGPKVRDKALDLLKSVEWMRVARFGFKHVALPAAAALATGGLTVVPAAIGLVTGLSQSKSAEKPTAESKEDGGWFKSKANEHAIDVRTFRERFEQMLKDTDIEKLIILIDDLDRCSPERVIENLEAIKLFLSVSGTAFIIGADPRIVEHAIRLRYAEHAVAEDESEEAKRLVKDYLEKVIQIPYRLPRLSSTEIETYMVLLFAVFHLTLEWAQLCIIASRTARDKNRYSSFGYADVRAALGGAELHPSLSEALTFCSAVAPLITEGLKGNPRQVKRFLNAFLLRKQLSIVARLQGIRDEVLVKLMILEYTREDLFKQLFKWQAEQSGFPKELAAMETAIDGKVENLEEIFRTTGQGWISGTVRQWVAMQPQLSATDLRDYFWIARDRLESTFSGLSMISPATRLVLNDLLAGTSPKRLLGAKGATKLSDVERGSLFELLDQAVSRHPEEKKNFDAFRALVEQGIPGAPERLNTVLLNVPLSSVSPGVGLDIATLTKGKIELQQILKPAMDRIGESKEKIGKAASGAVVGGKK
jgi:hypothetical protein